MLFCHQPEIFRDSFLKAAKFERIFLLLLHSNLCNAQNFSIGWYWGTRIVGKLRSFESYLTFFCFRYMTAQFCSNDLLLNLARKKCFHCSSSSRTKTNLAECLAGAIFHSNFACIWMVHLCSWNWCLGNRFPKKRFN